MATIKEKAITFLKLCAAGQSRKAFAQFVGPGFKHHNVYFRGDAQTLMEAMEENARLNPNKVFEVQRALEDGDLVAVHSRIMQNPSDLGAAVVHIFRFRDGKIEELWDLGQAVPENSENENGMF